MLISWFGLSVVNLVHAHNVLSPAMYLGPSSVAQDSNWSTDLPDMVFIDLPNLLFRAHRITRRMSRAHPIE
eukprot:scaffold11151_cov155-Amphora_coffeaeformis.AAC.1